MSKYILVSKIKPSTKSLPQYGYYIVEESTVESDATNEDAEHETSNKIGTFAIKSLPKRRTVSCRPTVQYCTV